MDRLIASDLSYERPKAGQFGYSGYLRSALLLNRPSTLTLGRYFRHVIRDRETGCWNWVGNVKANGYGSFAYTSAHRFACQWFGSSIPDGYDVDHLCRNKVCVNPAHLEPVTKAENLRRKEALRTHCKQGHPRAIYWRDYKPFGKCMECSRIWSRNYDRRIRLEATHV